ncbi:DUF1499 domain-containing protein [Caenispirillum salinarum]|uniref:DUF1499 domain-containing protein n=1 Tax=Caenispirillum salinarum TaxID=859058 RepID=UPI00384FF28A
MKARTVLGLAAVLPLVGYVAVAAVKGRDAVWSTLFGPPERHAVVFETWDRAPAGNEYILCPAGLCPGQTHGEAPEFAVPATDLKAAWDRVVASKPHTERLAWDDAAMQGDWEVRTPLLRFPDTVTVRFVPLAEDRSTLAVFSRSHYGKSDLGTNGRRVTQWLDDLRAEVAA